jgi:hypothetical protein
MTIKSQPLDFAVSIIAVAGCASETCKSSTNVPICSAMARASSSTLPARILQAASQSCWEIPPPACPLTYSMTGSGSVTVMTRAASPLPVPREIGVAVNRELPAGRAEVLPINGNRLCRRPVHTGRRTWALKARRSHMDQST